MDSSSKIDLIEQLADEFAARQQRGEKPSIGEYVERFPDLTSEIRDVLAALVMMEQVVPVSEDLKESAKDDRKTVQLESLGDYRILREIGRGGMGIVYEAEQQSLRRRVALKVLPKQSSADERSLQRFQREARAAARMHHTNIVPVFDVGQANDWVFYAMQLIQGQGLDLVVDDLKRIRSEHASQKPAGKRTSKTGSKEADPAAHSIAASLMAGKFQEEDLAGDADSATEMTSDSEALAAYAETIEQQGGSSVSATLPGQSEISSAETNRHGYFRSVAEIGLQTAQALAYAHARGIIHRDIKPSNLLLDAAGTVWITDFGLAKTGDDGMTHTGDILGTIRYMSPERFRGQCDNRADIYSLGLTLYELLVLKPAFESPDRLRLIEMVTKSEPELPRSLDPRIPRDLETIVLKCIDKDARHRYQSADELTDDLQRFVADEPIRARRISVVERLARWSRRNKSLGASLAFAASLLLIINIVGPLMTLRLWRLNDDLTQTKNALVISRDKAVQDRVDAVDARRIAVDAQQQLERELYRSDMQRTRVAYQDGNIAEIRNLLDQYIPVGKSHDLRGWEWYYWWRASHLESRERSILNLYDLVVAPDESWIAVRGWVNDVYILDGQSWKTLHSFTSNNWIGYDRRKLAVSADGKLFAALAPDSRVRLWRTLDWSELEPIQADHDQTMLAFSKSGLLATGDAQGRGTLWNVDKRSVVGTPLETGQSLLTLTFSPDGSKLLTGGTASRFEAEGEAASKKSPASLIVWDVESRAPKTIAIAESDTAVVSSDWASRGDGSVIAAGFSNGKVLLLDGATFQKLHEMNADAPVKSISLSSSGSRLAASTHVNNSIQVWETETARRISNIRAHSRRIGDIAFTADGETILSAAGDSSLKSWNLAQSQSFTQWRLPDIAELDERGYPGVSIALGTDDQFRCHYHKSGQVQRWSTLSGESQEEINLGAEGTFAACSDNLGFMAIYKDDSSNDENLEVWKIDGAEPVRWQQATIADQLAVDDIVDMTVSNDGSVVAYCAGGEVHVLKVDTSDHMQISPVASETYNKLVLSPDGKFLAGWDGFLNQIWNVSGDQAERLARINGSGPIYDAKFSADGTQFAQALWNNDVRIMDPLTGEVIQDFAGHAGSARTLDFSPDGKRLASGGDDGIVRLWNLESNSPGLVLALSGHRTSVGRVAFSADGDAIGSVSVDGDVRVWKRASGSAHMGLSTELIARFVVQEEFDEVRPRLEAIAAEPWNDESIFRLQLGVLYAYLGDREAHTRYSREWLQRSASTQNAFEADRCAKTYLIMPEPHDRQLLEQAILLGRRCADLGKENFYFSWFALCRGIAEFRAGAHAEAVEWLSQAVENPGTQATASAYLAMAEFQLGRAEKASRLLQEAKIVAEQTKLDGDHWHNLLVLRMAVEEATGMILSETNQ